MRKEEKANKKKIKERSMKKSKHKGDIRIID